ncbi:MAG: acetate kinase, partial [Mariprofundaceae bacterium]|nr:acetate kinase [Mariprofundaceae bacterium]
LAERLGQTEATLCWSSEGKKEVFVLSENNLDATLQQMLSIVSKRFGTDLITAVGHRIVHGGEKFIKPTLLNTSILDEIASISHLAPLHNPANLSGVRAAMKLFPRLPHIAVFDTAFHHAMPSHAYMYAVPYQWYREYGVRRYGFHGTSHHYVAQAAADILGYKLNDCQLITVHLGNGCSATAVKNGVGVDTTMGMTPLEGLVMGTRSGDVDPGMHDYITKQSGDSLEAVTASLNSKSGLLGLSEKSNDMRTLLAASEAGEEKPQLAINLFCYRLAKAIAALTVALERLDGLVFTGGIGENADTIREKTCLQLTSIGIKLDTQKNQQHGHLSNGYISQSGAKTPVLVIATDEEWMIAKYVASTLHNRSNNA